MKASALHAGLAGALWWGVASAAPQACIFNDALITTKLADRIHAAAGLSGTRIDLARHTAVGLLGDDLFQVQWWGCDRRGLDAWLIAVHPSVAFSDRAFWVERILALGAIVMDARDFGKLEVASEHPKQTGAGLLVETDDSSFDRVDVLVRGDGDLGIVRLNASGK